MSRVTESLYSKAARMLASPALLTAAEHLAAENVIGAYLSRSAVAVADVDLVERARTAPMPVAAPRAKMDWLKVRSEAARLGYTLPPEPLNNARRGQIAKELRALGAEI